MLQDWTIRSWDLDTEHTYVLYSPSDRKSENSGGGSIEVHVALTPLKPWIFFAAHRRLSVNGKINSALQLHTSSWAENITYAFK